MNSRIFPYYDMLFPIKSAFNDMCFSLMLVFCSFCYFIEWQCIIRMSSYKHQNKHVILLKLLYYNVKHTLFQVNCPRKHVVERNIFLFIQILVFLASDSKIQYIAFSLNPSHEGVTSNTVEVLD